jgi:hypothetical protein
VATRAKSARFVAAWALLMLVGLVASAVALRYGYERSRTYTAECASTPTTRALGRLTLLSSGVSLVFAAAAGMVLFRRAGKRAQWTITGVVVGVIVFVDFAALFGGSMCIGFTGGPD